ncbi:MAG: coenzyme F420-0:L-glutamate ligase [Bdellovibrionales bacterium]|nr:coenzyme F420-0:L-glutamate ligase [Bdellovibrionales bacterium]NQZ18925.1 coenzyme F420-0:L-glutamate ligase [Bdellovibrionales bacterium]
MNFRAIQTELYHQDKDLVDFIIEHLDGTLKEGQILAVTSKIVSLWEKSFAPAGVDKEELVRKEADQFLGEIGYGCYLTIKDGLLIATAGIDESNSQSGEYILYPKDPYTSAEKILKGLKQKLGLNNIGVILTDSHTIPLRRGVTGVTLSYAGFKAVKDMVGEEDLFGRELKMTSMNIVDGLSATATLMMGEGAESRPLVVIGEVDVQFTEESMRDELGIDYKMDLYYPLYEKLIENNYSKD